MALLSATVTTISLHPAHFHCSRSRDASPRSVPPKALNLVLRWFILGRGDLHVHGQAAAAIQRERHHREIELDLFCDPLPFRDVRGGVDADTLPGPADVRAVTGRSDAELEAVNGDGDRPLDDDTA